MDNTKQPSLTAISIGPGIRGIERGVERVLGRIRELALVEIEGFIIENLVCQMEQGFLDPAVIWTDVKTFPTVAHIFRDIVDWLFAGYSCQPFSHAGKRLGAEDPRHIYPYIEKTIDIVRPRGVFFENVRGHVTLGLREVIASLEGMGYRVHWGIFSAEETGASHKRERVFILAIRNDWLENTANIGLERSKFKENKSRDIDRIPVEGTSQLGNPSELHAQRCNERPWQIQSGGTGDEPAIELADSNDQWQLQQKRNIKESGERIGNGSGQLANACEYNLQRIKPRISDKKERSFEIERPTRPQNRIVARPGEPQHEWESPRTTKGQWETKCELGSRIDGYSFREDFLRALGNSVYPDSAELAFVTLLRKHGI